MTFGTILAYLGIGVVAGTIAGIGFVLLFAVLLVLYLKRIEERELAERFGEGRDGVGMLPGRHEQVSSAA